MFERASLIITYSLTAFTSKNKRTTMLNTVRPVTILKHR